MRAGPSSPLGGWKKTITLVLAITTLAGILAASEK